MSLPCGTGVCEHGNLERQCLTCELTAEVASLRTRLSAESARADAAEARARELEAEAATMRERVTSALHLEMAAVLDPSVRDASATLGRAQKAEATAASLRRSLEEARGLIRDTAAGGRCANYPHPSCVDAGDTAPECWSHRADSWLFANPALATPSPEGKP